VLHRYAQLVAGCTFLLIFAGGMVTSTGSGLAVPDWPTTYGYSMFAFPLSWMRGGIFYEHGHRLIASTVGMLTIVLAIWLWRADVRPWMRRLGFVALAAVIVQGLLGGITVRYFLPAPVSIGHAGLAEIFFALTVSIALFTSRGWLDAYGHSPVDDARVHRSTIALAGMVYAQILAGATMRHTDAGLAIPDFPLAFGGIVPDRWSAAIGIHFAHRVGALLTAIMIGVVARQIWTRHSNRSELVRPATFLCVLVVVQIALGGLTVLSGRAPLINTAHVAGGALVWATSVLLALRANRLRFALPSPLRTSPVHVAGHATPLGARA
jgi:heme a synthase